ncbi:MAG TPA: hypothetical protein VFO98_15845 [Marmoricola sp.]|nr:hypothetical protein [Marmoricola sp.]
MSQENAPEGSPESAVARAVRRRRLARVFGDDLPEQTRDDLDPDVDERSAQERSDAWLRRQKPPHHGG